MYLIFEVSLKVLMLCSIVDSAINTKISTNGKWFIDEYGRVRLFHGINAVRKEPPWLPNATDIDLTNVTQLDNLQKWGFNAVRLGIMWSGLKPEKNLTDMEYLNKMISIINELSARNIYVMIDLHQDQMAEKFGSTYDGFPKWLVDMYPPPPHDFPYPFGLFYYIVNSQLLEPFFAYSTEANNFAWQVFYDNYKNFQSYFFEYWSIVSKALVGFKSVMGYDILNEPWTGNVYANPKLFSLKEVVDVNLQPLYDKVYDVIRANDNDTIVFYEPPAWGLNTNNLLFQSKEGTGFTRPPRNDTKRTALSWHYYCWFYLLNVQNGFHGLLGLLGPLVCNSATRNLIFKSVIDEEQKLKTPSFLTEFGGCAKYRKDGSLFADECKAVLDAADNFLYPWMYWDSQFYLPNDQVNQPLVEVFSRIYPVSTSGIPRSFNFDSTTRIFNFTYTYDPLITQPTEIFIPDHIYPKGIFTVMVSNHLKYSFDKANRLLIVTSNKVLIEATLSSVIITP